MVKNVAYESSFHSKTFVECKHVVLCTHVLLPSCQTVVMDVRKQDFNLNVMSIKLNRHLTKFN